MSSQWTHEAIRGLGATTDLPTLGSIFGVSRWRSYQMAHTGEWEQVGIRIVPIGTKYRVVVVSILEVLGYSPPSRTGVGPAAPNRSARDNATMAPPHPAPVRAGHPQAGKPLRRPAGPTSAAERRPL
jgi:hypothetical protein